MIRVTVEEVPDVDANGDIIAPDMSRRFAPHRGRREIFCQSFDSLDVRRVIAHLNGLEVPSNIR